MATALKLRSDIIKLKKALQTKGISDSVKLKLKNQLEKTESELNTIKKTGKAPKRSSVKSTKTALTALQKLVNRKKYSVYKGAGVDLKKDAGEGALATGRRESKGLKSNQHGDKSDNKGNVYYEYRPNRLDVKQPKKKQTYPKLANGGMMSKGGYMAKGGELATYRILEKHKYALQPKWEVEKFQTGGREFLTFKQAQDFKNKLQRMSSSFEYKVEKVPTTKIDQSKIYYMADGGMMADGGIIDKEMEKVSQLVGYYHQVKFESDAASSNDENAKSIRLLDRADNYRKESMSLIETYNKKNNTNFSFKDFNRDGTLRKGISSGLKVPEDYTNPKAEERRYKYVVETKYPYDKQVFITNFSEEEKERDPSYKAALDVLTKAKKHKDFQEGHIMFSYYIKGFGTSYSTMLHTTNKMADGGMMAKGGEIYGGFKIKVDKKTSPYNKDYNGIEVKVDKDGVPLKYVLQALVDFKDKAYLDKAFETKNVQVFVKMDTRYVPLGHVSKRAYDNFVAMGGMMADGGKIKDQYDGKTSKEVWNNLSKDQKQHFIYDHATQIEDYRGKEYGELTSKEIISAYNSDYDKLDKIIKNRFDNHVREGQYAKGGYMAGGGIISKTHKLG